MDAAADRNLHHIQRLEERNRLKRLSAVKSKEELDLEEKERGFSTHFRGANASASDKGATSKRFAVLMSPAAVGGKLTALSRLAAAAIVGGTRGDPAPLNQPQGAPVTEEAPESANIEKKKGWMTSFGSSVLSNGGVDGLNASAESTGSVAIPQTYNEKYDDLLSSPLRNSRKLSASPLSSSSTPQRQSITELLRASSPASKVEGTVGALLMQRIAGLGASEQAMLLKLLDSPPKLNETTPSPRRGPAASSGLPSSSVNDEGAISGNGSDSLTIRIRIHSAWGIEASKYASLAGIRLQLVADENDALPNSVDILKFFKVQILSGLQALPFTSDAVRKVNTLFISSIGSSMSCWKGPLLAGSPLEIRLQADPEANFMATFGGREKVVSSLKLALWNAEGSSHTGETITESPPSAQTATSIAAKEVDIYNGSRCIYSGQLPLLEGGKLRRLGRELISPSLVVSLFSAYSHQVGAKSPALEKPESPVVQVDNAPPVWLDGLIKPATPLGDTQPARVSRPASGRRSLSAQAEILGSRKEDTPLSSNVSSPYQQKPSSSEKKRPSRQSAAAIEFNPPEMLGSGVSENAKVSDEENFRRSISQADRLNRGRIGRNLAYSNADTTDGLDASMDSLTSGTARSTCFESSSYNAPISTLVTTPSSSLAEGGTNPSSSSKASRNKRIDEVQHVVQSTLAGLADIMSDIQLNRKSPKQPGGSPLGLHRPDSELTNVSPVVQSSGSLDDSGRYFSLPILPKGRVLTIEILSTWGDAHYVGLNGIDIFDVNGSIINAKSSVHRANESQAFIESIEGNPPDINILPEYGQDPRKITNLVDGTNFTRDDMHVWLAPLGYHQPSTHSGEDGVPIASINIRFTGEVSLSLIRIFNYNKSRTYSFRGVRCCRIVFDGNVIFNGELRIAPGQLTSADAASEVILFTTDSHILENVAKHDEMAGYYTDDATSKWVEKLMDRHFDRRPSTADKKAPATSSLLLSSKEGVNTYLTRQARVPLAYLPTPIPNAEHHPGNSFRPRTTAEMASTNGPKASTPDRVGKSLTQSDKKGTNDDDDDDDDAFLAELRDAFPSSPPLPPSPLESVRKSPITLQAPTSAAPLTDSDLITCTAVKIVIESTWGDANFVGLAGLSVLVSTKCTPLALESRRITAEPKDLSALGRCDDPRTPEKLIDGLNNTTDDSHMWLIPFAKGSNHSIQFEWNGPEMVAGIRVWNYNKAGDDVRGVKVATIVVSDKQTGRSHVIGRCILRPAPGCDGVNFGQTIFFRDVIKRNQQISIQSQPVTKYMSPPLRQDYEVPYLPSGQLWKFTFYENFGDGYYLGLDGIEMFDSTNKRLSLDEIGATVTAVPHSLNDLTSSEDPRTPENLFFPAGQGFAPGQELHLPWLAPIARCMTANERAAAALRVQKPRGGAEASLQKSYEYLPDNALFVMFQEPVTLSLIRLYNYSKTPSRGVRTLAIHIDGRLIFMGHLLPSDKEFSVPGACGNERRGQSIVFVTDPKVVRMERDKVPNAAAGAGDQDVLCIDEKRVMVKSRDMYSSNLTPWQERENQQDFSSIQRPSTSLKPQK